MPGWRWGRQRRADEHAAEAAAPEAQAAQAIEPPAAPEPAPEPAQAVEPPAAPEPEPAPEEAQPPAATAPAPPTEPAPEEPAPQEPPLPAPDLPVPVSPAPIPVSPAIAPVSPAPIPVSPAVAPVSPAPAPVSPAVVPVSPAVAPISPAPVPVGPVPSPTRVPAEPLDPGPAPLGPTPPPDETPAPAPDEAPAPAPDEEPTPAPDEAPAAAPVEEPTPAPDEEPAPTPGKRPGTSPVPVPGEESAPVSPGVGPARPEDADVGAPPSPTVAADDDAPPAARPAPRTGEAGEWRGVVLVTGTDGDVGKTVVTSAIAAAAQAAGLRVAVLKLGQTGAAHGAPSDTDTISRLVAPRTCRTLASYPEELPPLPAARFAGLAPLELYEVVDTVRAESGRHDLVLVEGTGGVLTPMGVRPSGEAWTTADLATTLGVPALVVARAGLGALNHVALTLEALDRRGVAAKVVLGAWPAEPELVHWSNLTELVPHLLGALPSGAEHMDPGVFQRSAPGWLTPALYGVLDDWRVWAEESG